MQNPRRPRVTPVYEEDTDPIDIESLGTIFSVLSIEPPTPPLPLRPSPTSRPTKTLFLPNRGVNIDFLLDTGSDVNILNLETASALNIPTSSSPSASFKVAGGLVQAFGNVRVAVVINDRSFILSFCILPKCPNIIGWQTIYKHQLLEGLYFLDQPQPPRFPAPINDLLHQCRPTVPMREAKFVVSTIGEHSPPPTPIQERPRDLSNSKLLFLEKFVSNMTAAEVLAKGELGDFLSPLHLVQKLDKNHRPLEGKFRCTVDLTRVNSTFKRLPCPIPSAPATASSLSTFKNKIVVDLKDGFFHIRIPPEFQKFFGVISKMGIHRFARMSQGFINSPTIFQMMMLEKVDFPATRIILDSKLDAEVLSFLDDIGAGTNDSCPYDLLAIILKLCIEANLTVLPENIQIGPEVIHLGKLLTARCEIHIANRHREAINSLAFPSSPDIARRSLAFLNYFRDFIPHFAASSSQLRLLASNKPFSPEAAKRDFINMKDLLLSSLPLRPSPVNSILHLHADFSQHGIGAVVMWSTTAEPAMVLSKFLSRSLRGAESKYAAIEGEALASLWVISQCHADILRNTLH